MPDERGLPTKEEIAELPRWAIVAFAARCARRVEHLFRAEWPSAPAEYIAAVASAISIAEQHRTHATPTAKTAAAAYSAAAETAHDGGDDEVCGDNLRTMNARIGAFRTVCGIT